MARPPLVMNRTLSSASEYASADDFQQLFACEMVDLFRLAFLLTASADKAEHCLILTMHECLANGSVFKRWLPVWVRNALIQNAIRIVMANQACPPRKTAKRHALTQIHTSALDALSNSDEWAAILYLSDFDRLVYVLCVLERYPARDCATFLGKARQEIQIAQGRAKIEVAAFQQEWLSSSDRTSQEFHPLPVNVANGSDQPFGRLVA
jgi:DNA-directed RNA polymerase specialized sigma24 family protein